MRRACSNAVARRSQSASTSVRVSVIANRLGPRAVHIWHFGLPATNEKSAAADGALSPAERRRSIKIADPDQRVLYRTAHVMLRHVLAAYLDIRPSRIAFSLNRYGKPVLGKTVAAGGLSFNLSHSGRRIAIAITRHADIGVDVEQVRANAGTRPLAERFFAIEERQHLATLEAQAYLPAFYQLWSFKEAYLKATGRGLSQRLDSFEIDWRGAPPRVIPSDLSTDGCWTLQGFEPAPGYKGAIVVGRSNARIEHFKLNRAGCKRIFPHSGGA